ncbi:hypothetical protein F5880DRAFT_1512641, partial [Lentinula raphanica]
KRGRVSPLSQAQQDLVRAEFPKWEELLLKHKLHLGKSGRDPEVITIWINSTLKKIKASPAFGAVNDTTIQVDRVIKDMFKNYRNNTFVKKNKAALVQEAISNITETPTVSAMEASKAADALVSFKTPASAKDIFREHHVDEIRLESFRMRAEAAQNREASGMAAEDFDQRRDDNGGAYFQKALTELWQKADQEYYKKMVNSDKFDNQKKFCAAMKTALSTICQSGALGPTEVVQLSGFRNEQNQVEFSILNAHHVSPENGLPPPPFLQGENEKDDMIKLVEWWKMYCERNIPFHIVEQKIPLTPGNPYITLSNGIPVLAEIDLANCSPIDLVKILKEFLSKLWEYTWPKDQERASIPLLEIQAHPDDFYDTGKYMFPVPLTAVATEPLEFNTIWALATYLLQICACSCSTPFTFRTKDDIRRRTDIRSQQEEVDRTTGQEIV